MTDGDVGEFQFDAGGDAWPYAPPEFFEITRATFLEDPTNWAVASAMHSVMVQNAIADLQRGNPEGFWNKMQQAKIAGKFLPLDDPRNPDHPSYTHLVS